MTENELEFFSDRVRLAYIRKPQETRNKDNFVHPKKSLMNAENDFVYVVSTPNYIVYHELWVPSCKQAFKKKYGECTVALIKEKMQERMDDIGKFANLKFKKCDYNKGMMSCIFKKR
jgi:hypothetical protein